jgi:hypothetical protein
MAETAHGDIVTPDGGSDFKVPLVMLAMANSLDPRVIGQYASKGARDLATAAHISDGERVVAWVDGGVGLCAHNGTAWVNLSPPTVTVGSRNYGDGQRVDASEAWVDPTAAVTLAGVVNGQVMDIRAHAPIRVDGSTRQSSQFNVSVTNASLLGTPTFAPEMLVQASTNTNEYHTADFEGRFYCSGGTVTVKFALAAGSGTPDLVMQQAQCWVTLFPVDAA